MAYTIFKLCVSLVILCGCTHNQKWGSHLFWSLSVGFCRSPQECQKCRLYCKSHRVGERILVPLSLLMYILVAVTVVAQIQRETQTKG